MRSYDALCSKMRYQQACAYLHDATVPQVAMVLCIHIGYAEWQAINAQLQVANPECTAHLALDILLKVHTSVR